MWAISEAGLFKFLRTNGIVEIVIGNTGEERRDMLSTDIILGEDAREGDTCRVEDCGGTLTLKRA